MPRPFSTFAAFLYALTSVAAHGQVRDVAAPADCRVRISAIPSGWIIQGFDPFGSGTPEATFSAIFTNEGDADCQFSPVFQIDQPPFGLTDGTGRPMHYLLLDLTQGRDVTPQGGRTFVRSGSAELLIRPKESKTVIYKLVVDQDAIVNAGTFSQDVVLEAQDPAFAVLGGERITVGINVLPSARIGLSGAYTTNDGRSIVDLGELREGPAQIPLQLRVQSVGTYEISVVSENSGRLRLGATEWVVPYDIAIDGKTINLGSASLLAGNPKSHRQGGQLPIEFFIGDISNRRAGVYSDVISIAVTAR